MRRALRSVEPHKRVLTIVLITTALFLLLGTIPASMQTRTPYDKDRLLKVVKLNALSTQEVVKAVQDRGVDFQLTPSVEAEFKDAGARPELLDTLRTSYRAPAPPPRPP